MRNRESREMERNIDTILGNKNEQRFNVWRKVPETENLATPGPSRNILKIEYRSLFQTPAPLPIFPGLSLPRGYV